MSSTLRFGVIVSGIAGSYVPHRLRQHTDVNQALGIATDDVLAWSGTEWRPKGTDELVPGPHTHTGVYVPVATLADYATLAQPNFTTDIEISGAAPEILFAETGGAAGQKIMVDGNAFFFNSDARNVFKLERFYSSYNFMSMGNQYRNFTASGTVGNPACVVYVDATAGNIVLTLNVAGDYYRNNGYFYSSAWIIFVRKDATANTVTISPNGAETIDGASTLVMTGLNSMVFMQAVVGGWKVISRKDATLDTVDSGWVAWPYNDAVAFTTPAPEPDHASGDTWETMRYRKINGIVHLRGSFSHGVTSSTLEATLPEGYRPPSDVLIPATCFNASNAIEDNAIIIHADGTVYKLKGETSGYTNWHVYGSFLVD